MSREEHGAMRMLGLVAASLTSALLMVSSTAKADTSVATRTTTAVEKNAWCAPGVESISKDVCYLDGRKKGERR